MKPTLQAGNEAHSSGRPADWCRFPRRHLGFAKEEWTPTFRGFQSFVGFYTGGEDYFSHVAAGAYDFREDVGERCGASTNCSRVDDRRGEYSTEVFGQRAVEIVEAHDATTPLFLCVCRAER